MAMALLQPFATEKGGRGKKAPNILGGFSAERLRQARTILRYSRELAQQVAAGSLSIDAALKIINGETRKRASIHESGHALIGRVVGVICGLASISKDHTNGNLGMNQFGEWDSRGRIRPVRYGRDALIILHMSGASAEIELLGSSCGGDHGDSEYVAALLADVPNPDTVEQRLRRMTRMLVRRHRVPISYISSVLTEHGTLSGDEIDSWWDQVRDKHLVPK